MASSFRIDRSVSWNAGTGTPIKYQFSIDALATVTSVINQVATINLSGMVTIENHPNNSRNSFKASDFAVLTLGGKDPADYPFTQGVEYYQASLPALPNAPQSYIDACLVEFRGDTWRSAGVNKSSLYVKNRGVILDQYSGESPQVFSINITFTMDVSAGGDMPIIIWNASGANSASSYNWLEHQVWASWFDFEYVPGATLNGNSVWKSCNRSGGTAKIYNSNWNTIMRTIDGARSTQNPPKIRHSNGTWYNQREVGTA